MCTGEEGPRGKQPAMDAAAGSRSIHGSHAYTRGLRQPGSHSMVVSRVLDSAMACANCCSANPFPHHLQLQPCQRALQLPPLPPNTASPDHVNYFFWPASFPTNPLLHFSRDSICNIWRWLCLKLGSALQSRAEFTTTPPFPSLCSGIRFDQNLWIFILWKEHRLNCPGPDFISFLEYTEKFICSAKIK